MPGTSGAKTALRAFRPGMTGVARKKKPRRSAGAFVRAAIAIAGEYG